MILCKIIYLILIIGPVSKRLKKSKIMSDLGADDEMNDAIGET